MGREIPLAMLPEIGQQHDTVAPCLMMELEKVIELSGGELNQFAHLIALTPSAIEVKYEIIVRTNLLCLSIASQ